MGTSIKYDRQSTLKSGFLTDSKVMDTAGVGDCGCNHCGDLEAQCRPRFFAGQLLTEEDLRRLDRYIVSKNKLHNRYLHGWGVVAGLDVRCNGCDGNVTVSEGYALSACGDDIIVPKDVRVDIPGLIRGSLKPKKSRCGEEPQSGGCDDDTQEWLLSVCYSESDVRGTTPLKAGKSDCGCSGEKKSAVATPKTVCEPTQICEGFEFRVTPVRNTRLEKGKGGALQEAFKACMSDLTSIMRTLPNENDQQAVINWCCDTKYSLIDYIENHPSYDCGLRRQVESLICPTRTENQQEFINQYHGTRQKLSAIALQLMFACLCRIIQPPVSKSSNDECVPLAVLTVDVKNGYKVKSICNWTTLRKYAITMPALEYWLSVLPIGKVIRESLERFCCSGGGVREIIKNPSPDVKGQTVGFETAAPYDRAATFGTTTASSTASTGTSATGQASISSVLGDISPLSYLRPSLETNLQVAEMIQVARSMFAGGISSMSISADTIASGLFNRKADGFEFVKEMFVSRDTPLKVDVNDAVVRDTAVNASVRDSTVRDTQEPPAKSAAAKSKEAVSSDTSDIIELKNLIKKQQLQIDNLSAAINKAGVKTTVKKVVSPKAKKSTEK